jgi:hypothetical protein
MAHYARLDENNVVLEVLVIEEDVLNTGLWGDPSTFKQTSYNTRGGVYYTPNTTNVDPDQSKAFRKNFGVPGFFYDNEKDAFVQIKPSNADELGMEFDEFACLWVQKPILLTQQEESGA